MYQTRIPKFILRRINEAMTGTENIPGGGNKKHIYPIANFHGGTTPRWLKLGGTVPSGNKGEAPTKGGGPRGVDPDTATEMVTTG